MGSFGQAKNRPSAEHPLTADFSFTVYRNHLGTDVNGLDVGNKSPPLVRQDIKLSNKRGTSIWIWLIFIPGGLLALNPFLFGTLKECRNTPALLETPLNSFLHLNRNMLILHVWNLSRSIWYLHRHFCQPRHTHLPYNNDLQHPDILRNCHNNVYYGQA